MQYLVIKEGWTDEAIISLTDLLICRKGVYLRNELKTKQKIGYGIYLYYKGEKEPLIINYGDAVSNMENEYDKIYE